MQAAESKQDVGRVEFGRFLPELSNLLEIKKEFATRTVVKRHIKSVSTLKCVMHSDQHGMIQLRKHIHLNRRADHVQLVPQIRLLYALESIKLALIGTNKFPDKVHLAESTLAQDFNELKVFGQFILVIDFCF